MYCFTASGKLLATKNHQDVGGVREMLEEALLAWNRLPAGDRRPNAFQVPESGKPDSRYERTPPSGGLILNSYTRILERTRQGGYVSGSCSFTGGDQSARDHVWLKESDWQSLLPKEFRTGEQYPVSRPVADRLARYHLVDNTRGEPTFWETSQVRRLNLTWTVDRATEDDVRLRLEGDVLLSTSEDLRKADRGFDVRVFGYLHYDRQQKRIDRLDVVAVGDHWGQGHYTPGARSGRKPLGIALELGRADRPEDRVPPEAARDFDHYLDPTP
jgi:hypothetical protein